MGVVDRGLTTAFKKLGRSVALYPKYFLIGSIVTALVLGTGLLQVNYDDDIQRLYSNTNGHSVYEKAQIEKYFPANYSGGFSPSRISSVGRLARLIVTAQDGGTIFKSSMWREIAELDELLHSITIPYGNSTYNYSALCAKWQGECWENDFLDLSQVMDRVENGSVRLVYPIMVNPETYNTYALPTYFSGMTLTPDNLTLVSAEATRLIYFLSFETKEDDEKGALWEQAATNALLAADSKWNHIKVYHVTYYTLVSEQEDNTRKLVPYFAVTIFLMCSFTVLTALSSDWVKAKPWVAISGIVAATLGTLAAFGFLCYIGITCIGINLSVPFIMLGIGIDDTFVMLSAWRQTNLMDSVPKRLSDTYGEAAVSITITTLTDMLSFYVGIFTPIPCVQFFCAYAGTCVLFIYFYQIFFFGAILAISGDQEAGNRHSVFWWIQATPKSKSDGKSTMFKLFFTGGIDKADPTNKVDNAENAVMVFFRDRFAKFLSRGWVQILILATFVGYLGVSSYGLLQLSEGLKEERLYHDDSFIAKFHLMDNKYFKRYQYRLQIAITTPLDYSQNATQERVAEILQAMQNSSRLVSPDFGENWLSGFTRYVDRYSEIYDYNITTEAQFINVLKTDYFPNNVQEHDVTFNKDGTKIIASRFIVQLIDTYTSEDIKEVVVTLREIAAAQKDMEVIIFHPWLRFVDQFTLIRPLTIQLLSIAAAIVMVVAIIFIPNIITSICVFLTIVSTEVGVLGLMALWGVSLDMISIVCLIMCIGFSVDFSAHISYAYISAEGSPEERVQKALYSLGLPILQGGGSTVIGVFSLLFISSYIPSVFFKVIFLVIVCASWHGLFVLPVVLLLIKPETLCNKSCMGRSQKFKVQQTSNA